jgi:hypothetical protein
MTTQKRVHLVVSGSQSNEAGPGERITISGPYGNPIRDPIAPKGNSGSMWPELASLCGLRDVWLSVSNCAHGATSIVESWVGGCRQWANGLRVLRGSYVLSGGGLWKSNVADGTVGTCANAPTGTADVTGADGVPWIYVGVPTAADVDGAVYQAGSPRFDPNGYCGVATARLGYTGFDLTMVYQSIGQGDRTVSTSRERFSLGLQSHARHMLASGAGMVMMGFTCSGNAPGLNDYFTSTLVPGWRDALAALSGESRVVQGPNLFEELGVLPGVDQFSSTPGIFNSDTVHMNNAALKLGAGLINLRMQALGL